MGLSRYRSRFWPDAPEVIQGRVGAIHRVRHTQTFQSIVKSFVRMDIPSVAPPELVKPFRPEVTLMAANSEAKA